MKYKQVKEYFAFTIMVVMLLFNFFELSAQKKAETNRVPVDWEPHNAIYINWPEDTAMQQPIKKVISALRDSVSVSIAFTSDSLRDYALVSFSKDSISTTGLRLSVNPMNSGFIRDTGPWFIFTNGKKGGVAKFNTNYFGVPSSFKSSVYGPDSVSMQQLSNDLVQKFDVTQVKSDLVIENSMVTSNSQGVAICFIETVLQRNPNYDLVTITNEMKRVLGYKKIIWMGAAPLNDKIKQGVKASNIFGFGGNGHIDSYVRFANDTTILIAQIDTFEQRFDPVTMSDFSIMRQNLDYLRKATNLNDEPFHIIEMPVPAMRFYMTEDSVPKVVDSLRFGEMEPGYKFYNAARMSYIDYLICNDIILFPEYYNPKLTEQEKQKDNTAFDIIRSLYPAKKIIRVNPVSLNLKGGGLRRAVLTKPVGINEKRN